MLHSYNGALHETTGSAELIPTSDFVLSYAVQTLKKNPTLVIEADGHTDSVGSAKKNLDLSQARAETGRLQNRRVSLKVVAGAQQN